MGMKINIIAGRDKESSSVTVSGTIQHVITDEERTSFKIGDKQLKDKVSKRLKHLINLEAVPAS